MPPAPPVRVFRHRSTQSASTTDDYKRLIDDLARTGATVIALSEPPVKLDRYPPDSPLLSVVLLGEGRTVAVDGATIQVYEFPDDLAADKEAGYVRPDGFGFHVPLGGNRYVGIDIHGRSPTYYFKRGRVIVSVGGGGSLLDVLRGLLGPEFAPAP